MLAIVISVTAPLPAADVARRSPVDAYYRVGRYTPLEVSGLRAGSQTAIEMQGAPRVRVESRDGTTVVLPLFPLDNLTGDFSVRFGGVTRTGKLPMRALGENEKLVGVIGGGATADDAQILFPGKLFVTVR